MITLTLIFSFIFRVAICPPHQEFPLVQSESIQPHQPLAMAFQYVESSFRTDIINKLGYTGIMQEGQEMINEANRICELTGNPKRFTFPEAALDSLQSTQVWYIVMDFHNGNYQLNRAANIWNPLGTYEYTRRLKEATIEALKYDMIKQLLTD